MQLIYRAHAYIYTATHAQSVYQPRVINWRYRLPGTAQMEIPPVSLSTVSLSVQPHAINWRYQIPAEV
jgi:hypothetical protein